MAYSGALNSEAAEARPASLPTRTSVLLKPRRKGKRARAHLDLDSAGTSPGHEQPHPQAKEQRVPGISSSQRRDGLSPRCGEMLTAASEQDSDTKAASRRRCSPVRHAGSCVPRVGSCHRGVSRSRTHSGLKRSGPQPPGRPRSCGVSRLGAPDVGPAVPSALGVLGE